MGRRRLLLAVPPALLAAYLLFWPVPIDPVAWTPPPDPGFTGPYAPNDALASAELLPIAAPEDVASGPDGFAYTGLADGRIVRIDARGETTDVVNTGGRPLGMDFAPDGSLVVADAHRGLLRVRGVGVGGAPEVEVLATEAAGVPFRFTDDVAVAPDGAVYFTDASSKFVLGESPLDYLDHGGHGRLLLHTPDGRTRVLKSGLQFANGVALAHDARSVLFTETFLHRVSRYWIEGGKRGRIEPVLEALPGFPDNIDRGPDGTYWVALVKPRTGKAEVLAAYPSLRSLLVRLPKAMWPLPARRGMVVQMDEQGGVVRTLQDPGGRVAVVTSAMLHRGWLYLGSYEEPHLARLKWP